MFPICALQKSTIQKVKSMILKPIESLFLFKKIYIACCYSVKSFCNHRYAELYFSCVLVNSQFQGDLFLAKSDCSPQKEGCEDWHTILGGWPAGPWKVCADTFAAERDGRIGGNH